MEPETLEGFLVPDELQKSIDGDRFMISDNEDGSEQGMISATNESLRRLSDTKVWGNRWNACDCAGIVSTTCDYSWKSCIRSDHTRVFPLVIILMTSKSESLYRKTFNTLIDKCSKFNRSIIASNLTDHSFFSEEIYRDLDPGYVITDSERALMNAFAAAFSDAQHSFCFFFHLSKNLYKFIQQHKLMNEFVQNSTVYKRTKNSNSGILAYG